MRRHTHNAKSEQNKSIVFRFLGGPRDGQESRWDVGTPVNDAVNFWTYTEAGTVGQVFEGISPAAWDKIGEGGVEALEKMGTPPLHRYEVVKKLKTATEVVVVCEYRHAK